MQAMEQKIKAPHVVLLASPGMGHLIPIAELAKRLVIHHNFTATVVTFSGFSSQSPHHLSLLSSLPAGITSLSLPHISIDDLPSDARAMTPISTTIARSRPLLHDILLNLKSSGTLAAFVVDNLGLAALPVAKEIGVLGYLLFTSCFTMLSVELHLPELLDTVTCDLRDHPDPLRLPGCSEIRGRDLPEPIRNRSHPGHRLAIYQSSVYKEAAGILVNSFEALEPGPAEALKSGSPPVYPIGPLVRARPLESADCLRWLDRQPEASVVFVSFGSAGAVSRAQAEEIALGLEMSKNRFLWMVRVAGQGEIPAARVLPEGFVERTKEVGMVVEGWAPQMSVLGHVATGGFISHCGWNSVLESLVNGVAMAAWPLQHEQPMNARMLVEEVRIAVRVRMGGEGLVRREEVCRAVRELMEGEETGKVARARARAREMREAAAKAVEEEGSSCRAFAEVVGQWRSCLS
ncbi:hydroquinone glucosyltransferase [Dendrobium catenatum]|uniref:Hydroquinone glucosyltransferase n=1 Tax=Dendrobium catenatum TaxID=906689 RepID=A0A2I0W6Z3_9ASPA|nr:hydroquinone glucosyltransferase [Dendrobium catenatum]PKU71420.1 Hydroquinone glucosyltransferase [Dendrobium catenatum]